MLVGDKNFFEYWVKQIKHNWVPDVVQGPTGCNVQFTFFVAIIDTAYVPQYVKYYF